MSTNRKTTNQFNLETAIHEVLGALNKIVNKDKEGLYEVVQGNQILNKKSKSLSLNSMLDFFNENGSLKSSNKPEELYDAGQLKRIQNARESYSISDVSELEKLLFQTIYFGAGSDVSLEHMKDRAFNSSPEGKILIEDAICLIAEALKKEASLTGDKKDLKINEAFSTKIAEMMHNKDLIKPLIEKRELVSSLINICDVEIKKSSKDRKILFTDLKKMLSNPLVPFEKKIEEIENKINTELKSDRWRRTI